MREAVSPPPPFCFPRGRESGPEMKRYVKDDKAGLTAVGPLLLREINLIMFKPLSVVL